MKRTLILTQVITETYVVEVELTDKELAAMGQFELAEVVVDKYTDRDITATIDSYKVEVLNGTGHTINVL